MDLPDSCEGRNLCLSSQAPIASGKWRQVFEYPDDPARLIKIARTDTIERAASRVPRAFRPMWRYYKREIELRRELAEYRRAEAWPKEAQRCVQRFHGFVETDLGQGLVVEAVRTESGALAPTLRDLLRDRANPEGWLPHLMIFAEWLTATPTVIRDFRAQNIVHDQRHHCFVLIDGLGDKTFIPLRAWNAHLNRRENRRLAASLLRAVAHLTSARDRARG